MEHHSGILLALVTNIRLDFKDLPGTNTLGYYYSASMTKKSLMALAGATFTSTSVS